MARTDLGKWMITNGGEYDEHTTYENLTMVKYGQSTYITLKSVTGVEPTDDRENYMLMAQGFDAAALESATVEDTHGVMSDGEPEQPPAVVSAQTLIDAIADRVMNQLVSNTTLAAQLANYIPVSKIVDNLLSTDAETVLSGKMGKQLSDLITANSNAISTLNSATFLRGYQYNENIDNLFSLSDSGVYWLNFQSCTGTFGEINQLFGYGLLEVVVASEDITIQKLYTFSGESTASTIYYRMHINSSWAGWKKFRSTE